MSDDHDPDGDELAGDDQPRPTPTWPQIIRAGNTRRVAPTPPADRVRGNRARPHHFDQPR